MPSCTPAIHFSCHASEQPCASTSSMIYSRVKVERAANASMRQLRSADMVFSSAIELFGHVTKGKAKKILGSYGKSRTATAVQRMATR